MFIVLEGIEGSGKTTQAALLGEWLEQLGVPYRLTREPGGTELGEAVRQLLLHGGSMPGVTELLLMLAARSALLAEVVRPALAAGEVVVADRYSLSTLAYQGYGRELDLAQVRRAIARATGGLTPDLTLVLEIPRPGGEARRVAGRRGEDRIERAGGAFHERVVEAYHLLADTEPQTVRLDGCGEPASVQARIRAALSRHFPETFTGKAG
ncbi:MAG: dTMP kinase [Gemmatimonadetes bacterium]|nr:dTMP kinase [Gemmatimonadota bacterium]